MRRSVPASLWLLLWLAVLSACTVPPAGPPAVPAPDTAAPLAEADTQPEQTGGLLQGPILRLATGMHTAPILKRDVDAAQRYLVTGSLDKSMRVWELATGRFLRTIRPPLGLGDAGKIDAVALSPDGSTIAAGGPLRHPRPRPPAPLPSGGRCGAARWGGDGWRRGKRAF
ncbi:MAG: hypothetical protein FJZ47_06915, partial [Candidatus Tectomicrobia bacterium]|nr:hypothetical protein [Candidatus Tectomicrobia bacterium]